MVRGFGKYYISRYWVIFAIFLILGLFFWWKIPETVQPFIAFIILLYYNIIPYIWMNRFYIPYAESISKYVDDKSDIIPIYEKYGVSKREQEIIKLILDGMSNQEIADTLFIATYTVKNHVYNVYQKLGVNTRYQLVHFFTKQSRDLS